MTPKDAALRYASKGWGVIPVHSVTPQGYCSCGAMADYSGPAPKHAIGKHPYHGEKGHREASTNQMQISTWWQQWPEANVSIVSGQKSGIIVIDVDKKSGGLESLKELWDKHGAFPHTPAVHSGGGGLHFFFKHPGFEVRGRRNMLPGIDVMADGGRIVAPPSNHKSGKQYVWDDVYNEDMIPAELPKWLLEMILSKQSKRKRSDEAGEGTPVAEGPKIIRNQRFRFG